MIRIIQFIGCEARYSWWYRPNDVGHQLLEKGGVCVPRVRPKLHREQCKGTGFRINAGTNDYMLV